MPPRAEVDHLRMSPAQGWESRTSWRGQAAVQGLVRESLLDELDICPWEAEELLAVVEPCCKGH